MENRARVVVPVDLRQHTEVLVEFAANIAEKLDAEISLIHVVEPLDGYSGVYHSSWEQVEKELLNNAEEKMSALVAENAGRYPGCRSKVIMGDIVDQILAYCEEEQCAMIIIGTHGRKGLEKVLLGSVANEVLKRSSCPVLMFNPYK